MIKVSHLRKEYGDLVAVDDVSFELAPGEILGFLGPNGAGKSTTMKMLTGFLGTTDGEVSVWGCDVATDRIAAQSHIGYLPEGAPCYEEMTPRSFLRFIGETRGYSGKALKSAVDEAVRVLSLERVMDQKIETLSKGFKRRVGLAQAILHDPDVLVLDEPTDGLDPNQKHQVREMIKGLSKEKIVIISTHILEEVSAVCNRVMVLSAGNVVVDTTPAELQARSRYHGAVTVVLKEDDAPDPDQQALPDMPAESAGPDKTQRARQILLEQGRGVTAVEVNQNRLTVIGDTEGLTAAVTNCLAANKIAFEGLMVEQGRLDDVFRDLTAGDSQ